MEARWEEQKPLDIGPKLNANRKQFKFVYNNNIVRRLGNWDYDDERWCKKEMAATIPFKKNKKLQTITKMSNFN